MRAFWIALVIAVIAALAPASAQDPIERLQTLDEISVATDQAKVSLDGAVSSDAISRTRFQLQDMRNELNAIRVDVAAELAELNANLDGLGPKPVSETESADVSELRARYAGELGVLTDKRVRTNALLQRVDTLLSRSTNMVRTAFYQRILAYDTPPFFPESLVEAGAQFETKAMRKANYLAAWWRGHVEAGTVRNMLFGWGVTLAGIAFLLLVVRDNLADRLWRRLKIRPDDVASRSGIAWMRATVRIGLAALSLFFVHRVSIESGLAPRGDTSILNHILWAVFMFAVIHAVSVAHYSVGKPLWRVSSRDDDGAAKGHAFALMAGTLYLTDQLIRAVLGDAMEHSALLRLETLIAAGAFAWVVLSYRPKLADAQSVFSLLLLAAAFAPLLAAAVGYAPLARYAMEKVAQIVVLFAYLGLVRAALKGWTLLAVERLVVGRRGRVDESDDDVVGFWTEISVDGLLFIAVLPVLLAIGGMNWSEIQTLTLAMLAGFSVGNLTISPANLLSALVVALFVLLATRITQRVLDRRVLPMARVNPGLRYSLKTLIGYFGLVIAVIAGVSTLGIDLSSLAIIAGALSVGIGFGLQSIVNNFVSGLILLIERPIKIGDWVVTNSGEGVVRRINVRSTEIETFDRCSIIVPNSELISSAVQNWTHRDNLARIRVMIGVTYDADPRNVQHILANVVDGYEACLKDPAPLIYFTDFGDSALMFDVRAFIRDANGSLSTKNELRHRIFEALKAAGIEIPFPQRVVHMQGDGSAGADPQIAD